jgi:hypothetical protein
MAVDSKLLALNVTRATFIVGGVLAGAIVGGFFDIVYDIAVFQRLAIPTDGRNQAWLVASVVGGAAGGFIVGYYASRRGYNAGPAIAAGRPVEIHEERALWPFPLNASRVCASPPAV